MREASSGCDALPSNWVHSRPRTGAAPWSCDPSSHRSVIRAAQASDVGREISVPHTVRLRLRFKQLDFRLPGIHLPAEGFDSRGEFRLYCSELCAPQLELEFSTSVNTP